MWYGTTNILAILTASRLAVINTENKNNPRDQNIKRQIIIG